MRKLRDYLPNLGNFGILTNCMRLRDCLKLEKFGIVFNCMRLTDCIKSVDCMRLVDCVKSAVWIKSVDCMKSVNCMALRSLLKLETFVKLKNTLKLKSTYFFINNCLLVATFLIWGIIEITLCGITLKRIANFEHFRTDNFLNGFCKEGQCETYVKTAIYYRIIATILMLIGVFPIKRFTVSAKICKTTKI